MSEAVPDGVPHTPTAEEVAELAKSNPGLAAMIPTATPKVPEELRQFSIWTIEAKAVAAAEENLQRAQVEYQRVNGMRIEIMEEILERINESNKTNYKVEQVRQFNLKKREIAIAIPKEKP